jgi:hypothetical protein
MLITRIVETRNTKRIVELLSYAGVQDGGKSCFCGSGFGRHGPGVCRAPCSNEEEEEEICGGTLANSIYETDIKGKARAIS